MQEMTFRTVGILPVTDSRWHIREGGGHIWFVNENPAVQPYCLQHGVVVQVVDAGVEPEAPLIQPKVPV